MPNVFMLNLILYQEVIFFLKNWYLGTGMNSFWLFDQIQPSLKVNFLIAEKAKLQTTQ